MAYSLSGVIPVKINTHLKISKGTAQQIPFRRNDYSGEPVGYLNSASIGGVIDHLAHGLWLGLFQDGPYSKHWAVVGWKFIQENDLGQILVK